MTAASVAGLAVWSAWPDARIRGGKKILAFQFDALCSKLGPPPPPPRAVPVAVVYALFEFTETTVR